MFKHWGNICLLTFKFLRLRRNLGPSFAALLDVTSLSKYLTDLQPCFGESFIYQLAPLVMEIWTWQNVSAVNFPGVSRGLLFLSVCIYISHWDMGNISKHDEIIHRFRYFFGCSRLAPSDLRPSARLKMKEGGLNPVAVHLISRVQLQLNLTGIVTGYQWMFLCIIKIRRFLKIRDANK